MANPGNPSAAPVPPSLTTGIGGTSDSVILVVNQTQIQIAEAWTVNEGILSQPATYSVTLGSGDLAAALLQQFQPGPKFKIFLYVGGHLQQTGYIDAVVVNQAARGAAKVTIKGRDAMAPLQDTYVSGVISANVSTYVQLVWFAMQQVGVAPPGGVQPGILRTSNDNNRNLKSGVTIVPASQPTTVNALPSVAGPASPTANVNVNAPKAQAKLHETWHTFLRRHLDRAGLFLWAAADGGYVLSAPNGNQPATYLLRRLTGQPTDVLRANVVSMMYQDDRTRRHSDYIVYGKGGGKALGRVKSKGDFQDPEMIASGYQQPIVFRDSHCHNTQEATFFARRKQAEERRAGWRLEYTLAGHTLPLATASSSGGGAQTAVLVADTIVAVNDQELGLQGDYYLESVERSRGPETTTTIRLMRTGDLLFGDNEE